MKYQHRYDWIINLGGFLWWLIIRFGRTNLTEEQNHKYDFRNFLFVVLLVFIAVFVFLKSRTEIYKVNY